LSQGLLLVSPGIRIRGETGLFCPQLTVIYKKIDSVCLKFMKLISSDLAILIYTYYLRPGIHQGNWKLQLIFSYFHFSVDN
jgi:hypothetical protein